MRRAGLAFAALLLNLFLAGCAWQQESDWHWKQWNPDYKSPWPADR